VADVTPTGARIFTNTQDAYGTRLQVQTVLNQVMSSPLPLNRIRLTYVEGSSVYGSAPYRDAARCRTWDVLSADPRRRHPGGQGWRLDPG